jgi:hypothetical protein
MKRRSLTFLAAIAILMILAMLTSPVSARSEITKSTCIETYLETLDPGTVRFPDGNIHMRGLVNTYREESPDPRNVGFNTVTVNANWHADGTGPMWGTFRQVTDEGGIWEGTWSGMVTDLGSGYQATGHGDGIYKGMTIKISNENGVCQVWIIDPAGD